MGACYLRATTMGTQTKRKRGQQRTGTCVYCGHKGIVTRDHVVPSCLTPKGFPPLAIVNACRPCNEAKSSVEDDFRDYLSLCIQTDGHPERNRLTRAAVRSTMRNSSPLGRSAKWRWRRISLVQNGTLRDLILVPNDPDPIFECLEFIVKGLHFHVTGSRLTPDCSVDIGMIGLNGPDATASMLAAMRMPPSRTLVATPDILTAHVWWFPDIQNTTCWTLVFLKGLQFLAFAGPNEINPKRSLDKKSQKSR